MTDTANRLVLSSVSFGMRSPADLRRPAAVNVVATLVAIVGVDRVGRRFLFIVSGICMVACEIIVAACLAHYFKDNNATLPSNVANGILATICFYVANFAWSWWAPPPPAPSQRHSTEKGT